MNSPKGIPAAATKKIGLVEESKTKGKSIEVSAIQPKAASQKPIVIFMLGGPGSGKGT